MLVGPFCLRMRGKAFSPTRKSGHAQQTNPKADRARETSTQEYRFTLRRFEIRTKQEQYDLSFKIRVKF